MDTQDRQRLVNAVVFFSRKIGSCSAKKLFKLLYVLDTLHFQKTGRSVTDAEYAAGDFGPYPHALAYEIKELLSPDLAGLIAVETITGNPTRHIVRPTNDAVFSDDNFSRRQLQLLEATASSLGPVPEDDIDVSDFDNGAWRRALDTRKHQIIPMEDSVAQDAPQRAAVLEYAKEFGARQERLRLL